MIWTMMATRMGYDGLLLVDKPVGLSSMDVVRRLRRGIDLPRKGPGKLRIGHAGTLDPLATGLLLICLGKATKLVEQLMGQGKVYQAVIDLSAFTTTDDMEGERDPIAVEQPPDLAAIEQALSRFCGVIDQKPPPYSAVHVNGQRAYKLARSGQIVDMPVKQVRIDSIDVLAYSWPQLTVRIACGRGTYIRSIARDLGVMLGTGGHLASLRRTAIGRFTVEQAKPLAVFEQEPLRPGDLLMMDQKSDMRSC